MRSSIIKSTMPPVGKHLYGRQSESWETSVLLLLLLLSGCFFPPQASPPPTSYRSPSPLSTDDDSASCSFCGGGSEHLIHHAAEANTQLLNGVHMWGQTHPFCLSSVILKEAPLSLFCRGSTAIVFGFKLSTHDNHRRGKEDILLLILGFVNSEAVSHQRNITVH